jgi:ferredoxin
VTRVRFVAADGEVTDVEGGPGERLLDLAWRSGQPLEGSCEGAMACSTCHVIVDAEDFGRLPPASEEEDDLLDIAAHVSRTSRLACQIVLREDLPALTVRIPPAARNWLRR